MALQEAMSQLTELGVRLAAVSVDSPEALSILRQDLGLTFELLSDAGRTVVRAWGLLNRIERGGIAFPSVFVLDNEGKIIYRSLDRTASRADVTSILYFLRTYQQDKTKTLDNRVRSMIIPKFWDAVTGLPRSFFGRR